MCDATPDTSEPLDIDSTSPYICSNSKKIHTAVDRALDHYLNPAALEAANLPHRLDPAADVEIQMNPVVLLAQACQSLASASALANEFSTLLEGANRKMAKVLHQIAEPDERAANRDVGNR